MFKRTLIALALASATTHFAAIAHAQGQEFVQDDAAASEAVDFSAELSPYGTWEETADFGPVWTPFATDDPDWAPYTQGRWLFSDSGSWYFVSDEAISPYGWIVYHYGRWIRHSQTHRWSWIPGNEWAPAWVSWRIGNGFIGWQPLPPDQIIALYENEPSSWTFVTAPNLLQADVYRYRFGHDERRHFFSESSVANRTDRRGSNPGIAPDIVSGATGLPVPALQLRPRLYPGTIGLIDGRRRREPPVHGPVGPQKDLAQPPGSGAPVQQGNQMGNRPALVPPAMTRDPDRNTQAPDPRVRQDLPPPPVERPVPQPPSEGARPPEGTQRPQMQPNIQTLPVVPREAPRIEQPRTDARPAAPQQLAPQHNAPAQPAAPSRIITPLPQQRSN